MRRIWLWFFCSGSLVLIALGCYQYFSTERLIWQDTRLQYVADSRTRITPVHKVNTAPSLQPNEGRTQIRWDKGGKYTFTGRVVSITDGDTIRVIDGDNVLSRVRLSGIDAPELKQAYGRASKKYLKDMVAGKMVLVESFKRDQHGRILGKVWVRPINCARCNKTLNTNHAQLLAGMAWWYRYYANEQSLKDRWRYESAEKEAKTRKRGLWAAENPINPYKWRKMHDKPL